jgi:hypothetical protein
LWTRVFVDWSRDRVVVINVWMDEAKQSDVVVWMRT